MYRLHVLLACAGVKPLKTDRAEPPAGAGAGAANVSPAPTFVGLNVPLASGPASGRDEAAASSSVKFWLVVTVDPPTSDQMIAFAPLGATTRISTSSGKSWLKPVSVTVTFEMLPAR